MTSVIHFKLHSALLSETLNFDGDYLSFSGDGHKSDTFSNMFFKGLTELGYRLRFLTLIRGYSDSDTHKNTVFRRWVGPQTQTQTWWSGICRDSDAVSGSQDRPGLGYRLKYNVQGIGTWCIMSLAPSALESRLLPPYCRPTPACFCCEHLTRITTARPRPHFWPQHSPPPPSYLFSLYCSISAHVPLSPLFPVVSLSPPSTPLFDPCWLCLTEYFRCELR